MAYTLKEFADLDLEKLHKERKTMVYLGDPEADLINSGCEKLETRKLKAVWNWETADDLKFTNCDICNTDLSPEMYTMDDGNIICKGCKIIEDDLSPELNNFDQTLTTVIEKGLISRKEVWEKIFGIDYDDEIKGFSGRTYTTSVHEYNVPEKEELVLIKEEDLRPRFNERYKDKLVPPFKVEVGAGEFDGETKGTIWINNPKPYIEYNFIIEPTDFNCLKCKCKQSEHRKFESEYGACLNDDCPCLSFKKVKITS